MLFVPFHDRPRIWNAIIIAIRIAIAINNIDLFTKSAIKASTVPPTLAAVQANTIHTKGSIKAVITSIAIPCFKSSSPTGRRQLIGHNKPMLTMIMITSADAHWPQVRVPFLGWVLSPQGTDANLGGESRPDGQSQLKPHHAASDRPTLRTAV